MRDLLEMLNDALQHTTEKRQQVFRLVYGIREEGTEDRMTVAEFARTIGIPKGQADVNLAYARADVFEHVCQLLLAERKQAQLDAAFPMPGTNTVDYRDVGVTMNSTQHGRADWHPTKLGEGSEEALRVTRRVGRNESFTAMERIHQRYSDGRQA